MQLKLSLRGMSKPPVWRRLLVPADIRLDRLHEVIQTAFGWTDTVPTGRLLPDSSPRSSRTSPV